MPDILEIEKISRVEFADIVKSTHLIDFKLRIILKDNSFIDIHISQKLPDKFGFHWECKDKKGTIYRYDNVELARCRGVSEIAQARYNKKIIKK